MKNKNSFPFFACLTLLLLIFAGACEQVAEEERVHAVTVIPGVKTMVPGKSLRFTAAVYTTGGATREIEWSVEGSEKPGTQISQDGVLEIDSDEEGGTVLTVKAVSIADYPAKREGEAVVTIVQADYAPENAADLIEALEEIIKSTPANHLIYIGDDIEDFPGFVFAGISQGAIGITLMGTQENKITWKPASGENARCLFDVEAGFTLVIEDIDLVSSDDRTIRTTRDLVTVKTGGRLEIKGDAILSNRFLSPDGTGNSSINIIGGEVIMHDGAVASSSSHGVRFSQESGGGSFTMKNGIITGNLGHGVLLEGKNNTITMMNGTISNHESNNRSGIRFGAGSIANPSRSNSFVMSGGTITNNDFGIRVVISNPQTFTKDCSFIMTGGLINNSSRHQVQVIGAPGFIFDKSGNSTIAATSTSRIQIRDMAAADIADYRDIAGPDVPLRLSIEPDNGNRYIPGSDGGTQWRLLRPQQ